MNRRRFVVATALTAVGCGAAYAWRKSRPLAGGLTAEHVPKRNPSLQETWQGREVLLYTHDARGRRLGVLLPPPAAAVWSHIDDARTVDRVVAQLAQAEKIPVSQATAWVTRELQSMQEAGLVYLGKPLWVLLRHGTQGG